MADSNTIIGESILIKGNLEGDEDLTVQGRVEGSINLTKTLIIEPNGVVKAESSVANAIVSGVIVGNLAGTDSVELTESGRMVGDIQAPRVIINEGALFKGKVDMGDLEMPRPPTVPSKPAYRPATVHRPSPAASRPSPKPEPRTMPKPIASKKAAVETSRKKVVIKKKKGR